LLVLAAVLVDIAGKHQVLMVFHLLEVVAAVIAVLQDLLVVLADQMLLVVRPQLQMLVTHLQLLHRKVIVLALEQRVKFMMFLVVAAAQVLLAVLDLTIRPELVGQVQHLL
jgi:hypothetical protein